MLIGIKIKLLREKHHLTQEDLSKKLHISRQSISKWEQGISVPQITMIKELVEIFNCTYDELLDDKVEVRL